MRGEGGLRKGDAGFSVLASVPTVVVFGVGSVVMAASGGICAAWLLTLSGQISDSSLAFVVFTRLLSLPVFVAGVAGVALFGYGAVFCATRLIFFRRPMLEIGSEGMFDRSNMFGARFVPWEEIEYIAPMNADIGIAVKDTRRLMERQNPVKRLAMRPSVGYLTGVPRGGRLVPFDGAFASSNQQNRCQKRDYTHPEAGCPTR